MVNWKRAGSGPLYDKRGECLGDSTHAGRPPANASAAHPNGRGPARSTRLSDAQLLERFLSQRDEAAFEVLVWRHGAMVYSLCRRLLRHHQDAEDAFQATFLILARKAHSIGRRKRSAAGFTRWLTDSHWRQEAERQRTPCSRCPLSRCRPQRLRPTWSGATSPVLDEEVHLLPEKYRAPFVLCYLEGKTNEEAALLLGCPKGTILSRLARARQRLRSRLTRRGVALSTAALAAALSEKALASHLPGSLVKSLIHAALAGAAGNATTGLISSRVAALTEGVLRAMFMTKVKIAAAVVLVVGIAVSGAGIGAGWTQSAVIATPQPESQPVGAGSPTNAALPGQSKAAIAQKRLPPLNHADDAKKRTQSTINLKQLSLAMINYAGAYGHLPAPAIYSKNGKALLSWRVALLPFLEQDALFKKFKLDEVWDGPHNKMLLGQMPKMFAPPNDMNWNMKPDTPYQVFVGKDAGFEKRRTLQFPGDITDGTSNTIMIVEAESLVPWTKPEDLEYEADGPLPELGGQFPNLFLAAFFDGSVHTFSKNVDERTLRALITRNGGEEVDWDKLRTPASHQVSGRGGGSKFECDKCKIDTGSSPCSGGAGKAEP